jgi:predicted ester cyclase
MSDNELAIRNALIENYNAYAEGLDSKNWDMVRACFADDVIIDYGPMSEATGPSDAPRKADDWMDYLKGVINKFDVTRHTITNHRVTISDEKISCVAYLTADHVKFEDPEMPIANPENVATVVGEYSNHYQKVDGQWKICQSALVVHYSTGNMALFI